MCNGSKKAKNGTFSMFNDSTRAKNGPSNMALYLLLGPVYFGPFYTFYYDPFYTLALSHADWRLLSARLSLDTSFLYFL